MAKYDYGLLTPRCDRSHQLQHIPFLCQDSSTPFSSYHSPQAASTRPHGASLISWKACQVRNSLPLPFERQRQNSFSSPLFPKNRDWADGCATRQQRTAPSLCTYLLINISLRRTSHFPGSEFYALMYGIHICAQSGIKPSYSLSSIK